VSTVPGARDEPAEDGRRRVAVLSVVAACVLVVLKLVTGLITGSLGLLAEAAHSGADLVAALLTLFAVQVASQPADHEHQFGHGKAEHLAALAESAFLIGVSALLGYLAIGRLVGERGHEIDAAWWAIAVLVVVIAIDLTRMLASHRASVRYGSPALAANALHFAGDLAGSVAVLAGLIGVALGWKEADSVAALIVAVLVILAAIRLLRGSVDVLMDRADLRAVGAVRDAIGGMVPPETLRRVRTRHAAGRNFVDVVIAVRSDAGLELAHARADDVERVIQEALPGSDVVVHVEPAAHEGDTRETATAAALRVARVHEVHNVGVLTLAGGDEEVTLHVKVAPDLTLYAGHEIVEQVEREIRGALGYDLRVITHIEPLALPSVARPVADHEAWAEREAVDAAVLAQTGRAPAEVGIRDTQGGRVVLVTIELPGEGSVGAAHDVAGRVEHEVRERCPWVGDVVVHTEPEGSADGGSPATRAVPRRPAGPAQDPAEA
jgi:cation diffusion facilitator family transporter